MFTSERLLEHWRLFWLACLLSFQLIYLYIGASFKVGQVMNQKNLQTSSLTGGDKHTSLIITVILLGGDGHTKVIITDVIAPLYLDTKKILGISVDPRYLCQKLGKQVRLVPSNILNKVEITDLICCLNLDG
jgi:hypothetical protein